MLHSYMIKFEIFYVHMYIQSLEALGSSCEWCLDRKTQAKIVTNLFHSYGPLDHCAPPCPHWEHIYLPTHRLGAAR